MKITKLLSIVCGIAWFNRFEANEIHVHKFEIKKFQRYDATSLMTTLNGIRSMKICLAKCSNKVNCSQVNYHKTEKVCELINYSDWTNTFSADQEWNHGYLICKKEHNQDCQTLRENDCWQNGVYSIQPDCNQPAFNVYCDMQDGGWTVIQRRYDGNVPFYSKTWNEYKVGFGDLTGEHWLGNDNIHVLTTSASYEIKFDLMTPDNTWYEASYTYFTIDDEDQNYKLSVGSYIGGTAGDSIWPNGEMHPATKINGMKFSTVDNVNDNSKGISDCLTQFNGGGWWYNDCAYARPNGKYCPDGIYRRLQDGVTWYPIASTDNGPSLMATTMKLRRSM